MDAVPKKGTRVHIACMAKNMQKDSIICPSVFLATSPHLKVGGSG